MTEDFGSTESETPTDPSTGLEEDPAAPLGPEDYNMDGMADGVE